MAYIRLARLARVLAIREIGLDPALDIVYYSM
jgi:hypothetical protein